MALATKQVPKKRAWLGIHFECCHVYTRIYKNHSGTQYVGRCPKCLKPVHIRVGEGGSADRFFRVRFRR